MLGCGKLVIDPATRIAYVDYIETQQRTMTMHPDAKNFQMFSNPKLKKRAYRNAKTGCNCTGPQHADIGCVSCASLDLRVAVETSTGIRNVVAAIRLNVFNSRYS